MPLARILREYENLKANLNRNFDHYLDTTNTFKDLFEITYSYLQTCNRLALDSHVPTKTYFSFQNENKFSRPVNEALYCNDMPIINDFWANLQAGSISLQSADDITKACYTIAMSFCCAIDILNKRDQKRPGTYFEYFVGHLIAKHLNIAPTKEIPILNLDGAHMVLKTDLIFNVNNNTKFHVPVKTSTRERAIQAWAHQRIIDGVYGAERFLGILTCIGETKLDHRNLEVVEICLPDQWEVYQSYIAKLKRIYYLDVPIQYRELNIVKRFGEFFHESDTLNN